MEWWIVRELEDDMGRPVIGPFLSKKAAEDFVKEIHKKFPPPYKFEVGLLTSPKDYKDVCEIYGIGQV